MDFNEENKKEKQMIVKISYIKNCGNGAGGFAPGNDCAGGGGGGGESSKEGGSSKPNSKPKKMKVDVADGEFDDLVSGTNDDQFKELHNLTSKTEKSPQLLAAINKTNGAGVLDQNDIKVLTEASKEPIGGGLSNGVTAYGGAVLSNKDFDKMLKSGEHSQTGPSDWSTRSETAVSNAYLSDEDTEKQVVFQIKNPQVGLIHNNSDGTPISINHGITRPPAKMKITKVTESFKDGSDTPTYIVDVEEDPQYKPKSSKNHTIFVNFQK